MSLTRRALLLTPFALMPAHSGQDCAQPGYVLASGTLEAAGHEADAGYAAIGSAVLFMEPKDPRIAHLRSLMNQPVELVIRKIEPRKREELIR